MAFAHRVVRTHFHLVGVARVSRFLKRYVFWNIHHHRTRTARPRYEEGFLHDVGHVFRVFDQKVVLDDGSRNAHGVAFLKRIKANGGQRHLPRQNDHRNAVHVSGGNAGDSVGHTRARCHQGHAYIARGAGVAVGRMHCSLFVPHQHVLNRFLLVQGVVNVQNCTTGVAPNELDAFCLKCLDQNFGAAKL